MNPFEIASHGPVIPVIVIDRLEDALPLAEALLAGGVKVLEVTLRTPVGLPAIEAIARKVPEAVVGVGEGGEVAAPGVDGGGEARGQPDHLQRLAGVVAHRLEQPAHHHRLVSQRAAKRRNRRPHVWPHQTGNA